MKKVSLATLPRQTVSHNPAIQKQIMLSQADLPHLVQFSQATFSPGQVAPAHAHQDMHEVFFVESGNGHIIVDGASHALTPGVCIAVSPGEVHEVQNTGQENLVLTYFGLQG